jgi:hypothetical protein
MMVDVVAAGVDELRERIAGRFARAGPWARVREYVSGLVRRPGAEERLDAGGMGWRGQPRMGCGGCCAGRAGMWTGVRDDVRACVAG